MSDREMTDEEIVEAIYGFAAEQMQQGKSNSQTEATLVEKGLDQETARTVVRNLNEAVA